MEVRKKIDNPIDKILKTIKKESVDKNKILFESGDKDNDLRSDLVYPEDICVCSLLVNDKFLKSKGLKPIYSYYLDELLRKRFSLERGSRKEFVNVNKKDFFDDNLAKFGSISNLQEVRK
jgi:hypothetical protein